MEEQNRQQLNTEGSARFTLIYKKCYAPIYRFVFARVRNRDIATDLVQDVFTKAFLPLSMGEELDTPLPLLYTIARNVLIDFYRKKKDLYVAHEDLDQSDGGLRSEVLAEDRERKSRIDKSLHILSEDQYMVITLLYMEELRIEEVAEIMQKSEEAIRQIKSRAQKQLKAFLENHE